jgi:hypothetical protein
MWCAASYRNRGWCKGTTADGGAGSPLTWGQRGEQQNRGGLCQIPDSRRSRWERLALAQRRGEALPPIEVYRLGASHFVTDGHHRVSIAAATGQQHIDAYVTQVLTTASPPATTASPPGCWR